MPEQQLATEEEERAEHGYVRDGVTFIPAGEDVPPCRHLCALCMERGRQ